ncbi:MAG: hypothetical protein KDJ26_06350 [Alphaproteobacteria bacterium]|nr:hypothetical protein [Alphaproteobacteria bacterium]MCB9985811.1 hypothetical protein [Micavibrio sp.]HPQ50047.1 hypothetical protein [Alphaproteobacteria bacterium]HRK97555.1 hypothetical protein [Alphaproteobacteria bacterium]
MTQKHRSGTSGRFCTLKIMAIALFVTTLSIAIPLTAHAEVVEIDKSKLFDFASNDEDVGLSFLKLAGVVNPEFEKLVVRTDKYKSMLPSDQKNFIAMEVVRLNNRYATFNPQSEGILIRIAVKVYFKDAPEGKQAKLEIKFPSQGMVYFPYFYAGIPVAVLPNGIENFDTIVLSEEEKAIVAATLDPIPDATLILSLKPISADFKTPIMMDGERQFPILCDIGYIGIHNRNTDQVWAWGSGDSVSGRKKPLMEIVKPEKAAPF